MDGTGVTRREELGVAVDAVMRAEHGPCSVLMVDGEPGIGKTHLLTRLRHHAQEKGHLTLAAGLTEVETMLPWAGVAVLVGEAPRSAFEQLGPSSVDRLNQITRGVSAEGYDTRSVAIALAELIGSCCAQGPTLLTVDDLHWLDRSSAAALAFAIRVNRDRPLAVVLAHRRGLPVPLDVERIAGVETTLLTLEGLTLAELHHVFAERGLPALRRPDLVRIHELSGGNPLYAIELARSLLRTGRLSTEALTGSRHLPMLTRMRELDRPTRHAAGVLALMIRPTVDQLRLVLGAGADAALAELEREHVITSAKGSLTFCHPLLREAARSALGELQQHQVLQLIAENWTIPSWRHSIWPKRRTTPTRGWRPSSNRPRRPLNCSAPPTWRRRGTAGPPS